MEGGSLNFGKSGTGFQPVISHAIRSDLSVP